MHYIQKDIILSLSLVSPQRFSQLQPARLPNNTFSYHLKKLVEGGYIEPTLSGYVATRKALKTMQYTPNQSSKNSLSPALITVIHVTNDKGEVLILNRNNQPFADYFGLPSGLVHRSESMDQAAHRELLEKTGINAGGGLNYAGTLDFQYVQRDSHDIFVHAVAFIYSFDFGNRMLPITTTPYGQLSWSDLNHQNILPEVKTIHELMKKKPTLTSVHFTEPD